MVFGRPGHVHDILNFDRLFVKEPHAGSLIDLNHAFGAAGHFCEVLVVMRPFEDGPFNVQDPARLGGLGSCFDVEGAEELARNNIPDTEILSTLSQWRKSHLWFHLEAEEKQFDGRDQISVLF